MKKVLIMMATYNGEKYLRQQLNSIIAQNYTDWKLAVQDDGSTDGTLDILKQYCYLDNRISLYVNDSGYHGAYINFHILANRFKAREEYHYYMFCDQDDIWMNNKIDIMVSEMEAHGAELPVVLYADMALCDKDGSTTHESFNEIYRTDHQSRSNIFLAPKVYGCNEMMNRNAFLSVPVLDVCNSTIQGVGHDALYAYYSVICGKLVYLPQKTMSYRRHTSNISNDEQYYISFKRVFKRLLGLKELAKAHSIVYNQSLTVIRLMQEKKLPQKDIIFLDEVERCIKNGKTDALKYLLKYHVNFGRPIETISRSLILILGLQKKYIIEQEIE